MKLDMAEINLKIDREKQEHHARLDAFWSKHSDPMDADGYPIEDALELIEKWHWQEQHEFMAFVRKCWYLGSWGWSEKVCPHEYRKDVTVTRYEISTAGWSGNEAVIRAMQKADFLWYMIWVQSRRGGHYIFEIEHETETD